MHDSYIQNGASRLNSKFFNKIWDDSGEGVPGTNVFSSGNPRENKTLPLKCSSSVALELQLSCNAFRSHSLVVTGAASVQQLLKN